MDTYHPEMQRWAAQMQRQRKEQERHQALAASKTAQSAAKAANYQRDVLAAARMAGA